jgi:VWFA-related protein
MLIAVLLLAAPIAAQQPAPPAPGGQPASPTFRTQATELVVLPVTVTDRDGRFMADLPRERFAVFDNERPQPIAFFSNEDNPVSIALVVDNSGSMARKMGEVVAAAVSFAKWSNPEDELFVLAFNDSVHDALEGGSVTAENRAALEQALLSLRPEGRTALYAGLLSGLNHLARARHSRRVIVLLSDGGDNASRATLDDVLDRARDSDVTIYTVGLFGENAADSNPGVLKRLAEATGGERFLPQSPGPLLQACERVAREIRSGYTVGYVPPDRDGAFHRVRVRVTGPDADRITVRTRPGYLAARRPES